MSTMDELTLMMKLIVQVFFTLAAISFLYRDNPIYKLAEHFFVGIAAGYIIVIEFHTVFMPTFFAPFVHKGLGGEVLGPDENKWMILLLAIPGLLGFMMFAQFSKEKSWLARWPMAVVIGGYSGLALIGAAQGDLIPQIQANLLPIVAPGAWTHVLETPMGQEQLFAFLTFLSNPIMIVGVFCCLIYFFFSKEHRGATGAAAGVGIWFLMLSFGASYGRTVATRVSLFLERADFLLRDTTRFGTTEFANWKVTVVIAILIVGFLFVWFRILRRGDETPI